MQIEQLNNIKNEMHKQFVNRLQENESTIKFCLGVKSSGITADKKALIISMIEYVSERFDNALVMFDSNLDDGLTVLCGGKTEYYGVNDFNAAKTVVDKYLA